MPGELLDVLLKRPDFHSFNYLGTYFIRFNVTQKPFDDPRVRRALALAVDKNRIVKKITRAGEQIDRRIRPRWHGELHFRRSAWATTRNWRDKLLAEAGYPGGKGFSRFDYVSSMAHQN